MRSAQKKKMLREKILTALVATMTAVLSGGAVSAQSANQRRGEVWEAASRTAISITGDITLTASGINILNTTYPLTQVREIEHSRLEDVGKILSQSEPPAAATLYRTLVPQRVRLMNKNTLCGPNEDARWMLLVRSSEELALAVFSGEPEPDLNYAVMSQSHSLCGTYFYVRRRK